MLRYPWAPRNTFGSSEAPAVSGYRSAGHPGGRKLPNIRLSPVVWFYNSPPKVEGSRPLWGVNKERRFTRPTIAELNRFRTFLGALASQYNDTELVRPSMRRLLKCPVLPQKKSAFTLLGIVIGWPQSLRLGRLGTCAQVDAWADANSF